jgi:hypothetical protein
MIFRKFGPRPSRSPTSLRFTDFPKNDKRRRGWKEIGKSIDFGDLYRLDNVCRQSLSEGAAQNGGGHFEDREPVGKAQGRQGRSKERREDKPWGVATGNGTMPTRTGRIDRFVERTVLLV